MHVVRTKRRLWIRSLWVVIGLIGSGSKITLSQPSSGADSDGSAPSPVAHSPSNPAAASGRSLEDRLRRMEEAYRRMEEANKKIQGQYDSLLKKYDDLNHRVGPGTVGDPGRSTSAITRPASRVGAVEYQEPPDRDASQGLGARGHGGANRPWRGFDTGTGGLEASRTTRGRGRDCLPAPSGRGGGLQGAQAGSAADGAGGFGAQGTEGRVFPPETAPGARKRSSVGSPRSSSPRDSNSRPRTTSSSSRSITSRRPSIEASPRDSRASSSPSISSPASAGISPVA